MIKSTQHGALGALEAGRAWVNDKVQTLDAGRAAIMDALTPLEKTIGGSGAMYVMAKLPDGTDDMVRILISFTCLFHFSPYF